MFYKIKGGVFGFVCLALLILRMPSAVALEQSGRWLEAPQGMLPSDVVRPEQADRLPTGVGIRLTGGAFWYDTTLHIPEDGLYVVDFRNSLVLAEFTHYLFDAQGQSLGEYSGGATASEPGEFFLRHGRMLMFEEGQYRLLTRIDSPFYIAEPTPFISSLSSYRHDVRIPTAITLLGLGIFLALGFYYVVMGLWRRSVGDLLYAGFIIGNLIYNSASQLVLKDLFGISGFYFSSVPILFSNVLYIGFVMVLLQIRRHTNPGLYWLGIGAMGGLAAFWPLALLQPQWSMEFARYGVAVFAAYGLGCGIVRAWQRNRVAYFYLIANVAFVVPAAFSISLRNIGIADTFVIEHLGLISVVLEVLLLAQVMSYQVGQVYKEREASVREAHQAVALAEESVRAKERFLANMSHELRTPLNAIHGTVELLNAQPLELRLRRQLDTINQSSKFLLYLINDVLDLAKIQAGKMTLDELPFDLDRMLQNLCDLYRSTHLVKDINLLIDVATDVPPYIRGDESRLKQILANLLSNAYKFTDHGSIRIEVRKSAVDQLAFAVVDTGVGIAPEDQHKIFDAFTQVDESSMRRHGGAGLGLQICRRLVEMMGGVLSVQSERGAGSRFAFTLPLLAQDLSLPRIEKHIGILYEPQWQQMAHFAQQDLTVMGAEVVVCAEVNTAVAVAPTGQVDHWLVFKQRYDPDLLQQLHERNEPVLWFLPEALVYDLPAIQGVDFEAVPYGRYHVRRWLGAPVEAEAMSADTLSLQHLHVVVVDDNPVNLRVVMAMLENLGVSVQGFDQAVSALGYVQQHVVDLVLMDIQMPVMDGLQASRRMREQGFAQPIVAFTATTSVHDRENSLAAGMNDVLVKPVRMDELSIVVRKWCLR
ncbi:ATP-binding protein [Salinispirillum marinum]|uniref:histidine kinase n=2 Tax=Saccharospirillaceae TaxID=255527 RepID=A0ABV8BGJ6_9GAMM